MAFQISVTLTPEHSDFINNLKKQGRSFSPSDFFRKSLQNFIDESLGTIPSKSSLRNQLFEVQGELDRKISSLTKALDFIQQKNLSGDFSIYLQQKEIDTVDNLIKEATEDVKDNKDL